MNQNSDRPFHGVLWMLLTGIMFVIVNVIVKHVGQGVPAAEAAFLRYVLGLVFLVPMLRPIFQANMSRRSVALFALRGFVHSLGVILWFFAMTLIPLGDVTAMGYMTPIYVTIGAALFLGEKLAFRRILAVCFALVGAFIILRPGFRVLSIGHVAMIGAALFFAGSYLIAKLMSGKFSAPVVVGMLSITVTIGLAPFAAAVWITPTLAQLGWLFLVACFATAGHLSMTKAFAAAPVTVTQPVTFLQLVWAVTIGAMLFGEPIDGWVIIGGLVIMTSVSFISWREAVLKKRAQPTPAVPNV